MKKQKKHKMSFEIPFGKKILVNPLLIPMVVFAYCCGYGNIFLLAYTFAFLHELAHIFCAFLLGIKISRIHLYPFGLSAELSDGIITNSEKEFFVALLGPLFSLSLFFGCSFLSAVHKSPLLSFAMDTNLALCAINLIPALPLDGGRMLKSLLTLRFGIIRAYTLLLKLSKALICFLFVFSAFLLFVSHFNFSLILISAFLLQNLAIEKRSVTLLAFKEIINSKQKAELSDTLRAKVLCVEGAKPASMILRHLSYDCFFVVHIMNNKFEIEKVLSETQVLEALTTHGLRTKFKDI